jgi:hypothetical protein
MMFLDSFRRISSGNMLTILELDNPRGLRVLRLLFFPTSADCQDGHLNTKVLEIKLEYKDKPYIHMKTTIDLNVHGQTLTYKTQRNGFLSHLTNEEYCNVFKMLSKYSDVSYPTWNHWLTLNHNVVEPLRKVMKHIILWYSRSWKYPSAHYNDLKSFNWSTEI